MNKYSLKSIESILDKNNISFDVLTEVGVDGNMYSLASIKSPIEFGIYYLMGSATSVAQQLSHSVIFVDSELINVEKSNIIIQVEDPKLTHYLISQEEETVFEPSVHPTAIISPDSEIGEGVYIGPYCIIDKARIGDGVRLLGLVHIYDDSIIGSHTTIESNSSIGVRGMAWTYDKEGRRVLQAQLGGVRVGENCYLGSDISIVRGSINEDTQIGDYTVMAHGSKIGHGAILGAYTHLANNVSVAGNAVIGERCFLGSGSVISSNIRMGLGCVLGAGAVLTKNFDGNYLTLAGVPAKIISHNNLKGKMKGVPSTFKRNNDE